MKQDRDVVEPFHVIPLRRPGAQFVEDADIDGFALESSHGDCFELGQFDLRAVTIELLTEDVVIINRDPFDLRSVLRRVNVIDLNSLVISRVDLNSLLSSLKRAAPRTMSSSTGSLKPQ